LTGPSTGVARLRKLLEAPEFIIMPCCYDGISAKLIQHCGYSLTFMSGFAVSAARLGLPDTGLISYGEMLDQGRNICSTVDIPVIGDGDTGYGNTLNVKRTVHGYIRAGFAGIMIEDQRSPKRCGHTIGKEVVEREDALLRLRAVIEARDEARDRGEDIVIISQVHFLTGYIWGLKLSLSNPPVQKKKCTGFALRLVAARWPMSLNMGKRRYYRLNHLVRLDIKLLRIR